MRKKSILLVCILVLTVFAISAPGVFAKPSFYSNQCKSCHGPSPTNQPSDGATCMGCHYHGGRSLRATPDRTEYAPGDTVMVTLGSTRPNMGGWIGAKLFDKAAPTDSDDAIDIATNPCSDCPLGVGGLNGITTENPATLIANAPSAPGTYTWSAAWHGNPSGTSYGAHRDVYAQFTFDVVELDVNNPPTVDAGGPYNGTVAESLQFDGSGSSDPDGTIEAYDWDFGDGSTGSGRMPTHTYFTDGNFTVTLTVTDDAGDTGTDTAAVTIGLGNQAPIADVNNPYNGIVDEPVEFDGSGSSDPDGTIVAYDWDFGDGNTGSGEMFTHIYMVSGAYNVTLTVTDDMGATDSATTTATIVLGNQAPIADANNPYIGTVDVPVQFDGSGSSDPDGTIVAYEWDFGDGNIGRGEMPTHTYATEGSFTVTLTVIDDADETGTDTTTATIGPGNQAPVADANNPYVGTVDVPLQFDGSGSYDPDGTIVAYEWDFGDGNIGSGKMPTHTYRVDGTYKVTLTVTDDMGATDSTMRTATIGLGNQAPIADVSNPYIGIVNEPLEFDGSGSSDPDGKIVAYDWDFGDGSRGSSATPAHIYKEDGTYNVTLTVTDDLGATDSAGTTATIEPGNQMPIADANNPYNGTVGEPVQFDGSGSLDPDGKIVVYDWDFGDGSSGSGMMPTHTYTKDGSFIVTLTVTDDAGDTGTDTTTATIAPGNQVPIADANDPYNGTVGEAVQFDGSGSLDPDGKIVAYDWDFGDGSSGSGVMPTHTYIKDGSFTVTLTVTDDAGDTGTDTTTATIAPGNQAPIADANNPYIGTVDVPLQFDGSGSSDPDGQIVAYDWNFGDGSSGSGEMPTHTYKVDGTYKVTLTVTDDTGATDSVTTSATIMLDDGDDDPPTRDTRERLKAVREDLMAVAKDREYSRKVRRMFSHSAKRLSKAAVFLEKGKIKNASKEVEKAIKKMKKAAKLGKRNHELKDMCKEFIHDMKKLKAAIKEKGEVISPDDDHDGDDDDDHHGHDHDDDDDDDSDDDDD